MTVEQTMGRLHESRRRVRNAEEENELLEAWDGLRSLLLGAWGTENLDALGGGKRQIERAFAVLDRLIEHPGPPSRPSTDAPCKSKAGSSSDGHVVVVLEREEAEMLHWLGKPLDEDFSPSERNGFEIRRKVRAARSKLSTALKEAEEREGTNHG